MRFEHTLMTLTATGALALSGVAASAAPIQIDFGDDPDQGGEVTSVAGWNTLGEIDEDAGETASIADLLDADGNSTGISLSSDTNIVGDSDNGPTTIGPPASNLFPDPVATDYFYGEDGDTSSDTNVYTAITFGGLDTALTYDFDIFAGRAGSTQDRTTLYTAAGANTESGTLNPANNTSEYLTLSGVSPDVNGEIVLSLADTPQSESNFGYINGLIINNSAPIPEPASLALLGLGSLAMLGRRRRHSA